MNIKDEIKLLNKQQREAVIERGSKRLLVLAGAGSGKTRVLTVRIAFLMELGVSPDSIFAVTFTNKAANEMKERIIRLSSNKDISGLWSGTFHSLSMRILKDNLNQTDIRSNFNILDSDDQKNMIKRAIINLGEKDPNIYNKIPKDEIKEVLETVQGFINNAKENECRPKDALNLLKDMGLPSYYLNIYEEYEVQRVFSNSLDFADLILYAVEILRDNENIRSFYQSKFRHIFVDEFQDTNPIQYRLINLITSDRTYHTMVGDDDQLIYSWRGANIDNIRNYHKENKSEIKVVKLEQNYRSYSKILNTANSLIKNNVNRMGKNLWSARGDGENIEIIEALNQDDEAVNVVGKIKKILKNPDNRASDIAILYRNNFLSRAFEGQLTKNKIPYKIIGGLSFWQRKEIKDIMSYLLLINDTNNDIAFERAISVPKRGFGAASIKKVKKYAYENKMSMFQSIINMESSGLLKGKSVSKVMDFVNLISEIANSDYSINRMINKIIIDTGIEDEYEKEGKEIYTSRKENLDELSNYSTFYDGVGVDRLPSFIQNTILQSDSEKDDKRDCVSMMTVHASKGLEFKFVFIVGFEDGIFPSKQSIAKLLKSSSAMEEERRLAYVAITRAQNKLHISFSNKRYYQSSFYSRFLDEVPVENLSYHGKTVYGMSKIGQKIRDYKLKNSNGKYSIGDVYRDDIMGDGEIVDIEYNDDSIVLSVDYGFLGIVKKII